MTDSVPNWIRNSFNSPVRRDALQDVVSLLMRNARIQGTPRPIVEVVVDEAIKILNARIPEHLRKEGVDVLKNDWTAMQCLGCGQITPSPKVSERFQLNQAALCRSCKEEYERRAVKPPPSAEAVILKESLPGAAGVLAKLHKEYETKGGIPALIEEAEARKVKEQYEIAQEILSQGIRGD